MAFENTLQAGKDYYARKLARKGPETQEFVFSNKAKNEKTLKKRLLYKVTWNSDQPNGVNRTMSQRFQYLDDAIIFATQHCMDNSKIWETKPVPLSTGLRREPHRPLWIANLHCEQSQEQVKNKYDAGNYVKQDD